MCELWVSTNDGLNVVFVNIEASRYVAVSSPFDLMGRIGIP